MIQKMSTRVYDHPECVLSCCGGGSGWEVACTCVVVIGPGFHLKPVASKMVKDRNDAWHGTTGYGAEVSLLQWSFDRLNVWSQGDYRII